MNKRKEQMHNKKYWFAGLFISVILISFIFALITVAQPVQKSDIETEGIEDHFQKAHDLLLKKDFGAASSEIRKSVGLIRKEAAHATDEGKKVLTASIKELEQLAKDIEKGTVKSEERLKEAFARAHHSLAHYHYIRSSESWNEKKIKRTGNALKEAAQHLEQAIKWSGHKLETGTAKVIKGARKVANNLKQSTKRGAEKAGEAIEKLGKEISKIGKK